MTVDELVDRFAEIGVAQDQAELMGEIRKFNKLYGQMKDVDTELRARGPAARLALLRLFDHQNMQVRLKAAQWFPQAGEAGMTLRNLESGVF